MSEITDAPVIEQVRSPAAANAARDDVFARLVSKLSLAALPGRALAAIWSASLGAIAVLAAVKLDLGAQFCLSFAVLGAMLVLRHTARLERTRLFFLACSAFLTFRYLYWRTSSTLGYNGLADFIFMLLLYAAELYGILVALLGLFVTATRCSERRCR